MASQKGSSKADTLVKVVLVFFISLLSFSVGTFVGKQVSDSDHRRLALEGEVKGERHVASADEHADADKITEKEVESLTEEFVNKEKGREPAESGHDSATEVAKAENVTTEGYKSYPRGKDSAKSEDHAAADAHTKADTHAAKADTHATAKP